MLNTKISLLFWNVRNNRLVENIVRLVQENAVDIVLLAESPFEQNGTDLLNALNEAPRLPGEPAFVFISGDEEIAAEHMPPVQVFSNLPQAAWTRSIAHPRYTIWDVRLVQNRRFVLAAAHFPEIMYQQGDEQRESAVALRLDLEQVEADWEDPFSIVVGDLNATPFDAGIVGVYGLNATPSRRAAEKMVRHYNGRNYKYLFNPMWRFLADRIPGTYYKGNLPAPIRYEWYLLDQVLVRPAVLRQFDKGDVPDVQILTSDGIVELIEPVTGTPHRELSDHLPILFRFYLAGE